MKTSLKYLLFCIIYLVIQQTLMILLNILIKNLKLTFLLTQILILITSVYYIKNSDFNISIGINSFNFKKGVFYSLTTIVFVISLKVLLDIPITFNPDKNIYRFLTVVLLSPIIEEIIFRGLSIEWLKLNNINKNIRVFLTALIFGLIHLPFNSLFDYQIFLFGIISALIYEKKQNLIYCILIHMSFNTFIFFSA